MTFWDRVLPAEVNTAWQIEMQSIADEAYARRATAHYDTGSILESEAYALRALAEYLRARVVIEVGTFIGTSTCALASAPTVEAVYTCDVSNDCLPSAGVITTFPKQTSAEMLRHLVDRGVKAHLCFVDGVLSVQDIALLSEVCEPYAVFALHDYNYGPKIRKSGMETMPRKGIGNAALIQKRWKTHAVVKPRTPETLALLVPESLV